MARTHTTDADDEVPTPQAQAPPAPLSMELSAVLQQQPKNSMIFSLLPSAVQSRLPRLGSFRRSVYAYGVDAEMEAGGGGKTGVEGYASEIVWREAMTTAQGYGAGYFEEGAGSGAGKVAEVKPRPLVESESGIDWKFANQGISLIGLSVQESASLSKDVKSEPVSFARQLYVHGLTYLLRGLPEDLTAAERLSLHGCIPPSLRSADTDATRRPRAICCGRAGPPPAPSILHRLLACTIVRLFVLFQLLFPYVKVLLRAAGAYEREHHLSARALASSVDVLDALARQGVALTAALYGMGNGRVGALLGEAAAWVVEGIAGGIHEGVGEGLHVWGVKMPG